MKQYMLIFILTIAVIFMTACGQDDADDGNSADGDESVDGDKPSYICDPGETQFCACPGGVEGVQECANDRMRWDTCQCPADGDVTDGDTVDGDIIDGDTTDGDTTDGDTTDGDTTDGDTADGDTTDGDGDEEEAEAETEVETNCVNEGENYSLYPGAPLCCEGLNYISCDKPDNEGVCQIGCVGSSVCANCGNDECGPGENKCNCPADCL